VTSSTNKTPFLTQRFRQKPWRNQCQIYLYTNLPRSRRQPWASQRADV